MAGPTGRADPYEQRRIEELRQHIQELVDEMTFYQIRYDSLAREGNPDAWRELQFFDEGFNELQAEILDLENQLHALEAKNSGDQQPFILQKEESKPVDHTAENADLVRLQKEEFECLEKMAALEDCGAEEQLTQLRFKIEYLRKEIDSVRSHG
ncbi:MAG: hypothetical protein H7A36_02640 [Chlamydiales bacterium]|nr:hypothetical protein [Chlamydiales bacterium]